MEPKKWGAVGLAVVLLVMYNVAAGPGSNMVLMRTMDTEILQSRNIVPAKPTEDQLKKLGKQRYGPSMDWLDRLMRSQETEGQQATANQVHYVKFDLRLLSSMMVAGLASGFKSQVANLLWMRSDEYWHKGLTTRQVSIMEAVVTFDPQFIEAWSTAGWHWAYNLYADIELSGKYKNNPKLMRQKQDIAINTGIDYLKRGAEQNPDTYRLWFEQAYTRAHKWGSFDEETVALLRKARAQPDARAIEREVQNASGQMVTEKVLNVGLDTAGHTIGHIYEERPDVDKALDFWGGDMLQATPQERRMLDTVGEFWRRYGSGYTLIAQMYAGGDETIKARVKKLVPDVERIVEADATRIKMESRGSTPLGAYKTIAGRYKLPWTLMKQGKLQQAADTMVGVMNADPRFHLTGLQALGKVMELRGDAPDVVKKQLEAIREGERSSSQDIGLKLLATVYQKQAEQEKDAAGKKAFLKKAYETWYRARARNELDFYAKRQTYYFEDTYGFTTPKAIVAEIQKSRAGGGTVNAAPAPPPNLKPYIDPHHDEDRPRSREELPL